MILVSFRLPQPADLDHGAVLTLLVDRIEERTGVRAHRAPSASDRSLSVTFPRLHDRLDVGPAPEGSTWDVLLSLGVNPYLEYQVRRSIKDLGGELVPLGRGSARAAERVEKWERPWRELPLGERIRYGSMRAPLNLLGFVFVVVPLELSRAVRNAVRPLK